MKIFLISILMFLSIVSAKTLVLEVCTMPTCYEQTFHNVKNAIQLEDQKGRYFVRIIFNNGRLLDITWAKIKKL
jgi:hypothetical protein